MATSNVKSLCLGFVVGLLFSTLLFNVFRTYPTLTPQDVRYHMACGTFYREARVHNKYVEVECHDGVTVRVPRYRKPETQPTSPNNTDEIIRRIQEDGSNILTLI